MTYYVIQVKTGGEEKVIRHSSKFIQLSEVKLIWPRRSLRIRKRGVWRNSLAPIFPGYLFIHAENITPEVYWSMKKVPGFYRFLKDNHNIEPIARRDCELLTHFLSYGEIVERSKVIFDENKRIKVISGPLKNLEGYIVKVDRRKCRAKVKLELYEDAFLIDFGFESIEKSDN